MIRKLSFCIFPLFVISHIGFSQDIERRTYYDQEHTVLKDVFHVNDTIKNDLNGSFISYSLSGKVKSQGEYIHNKASGDWVYFYENGNIKNTGSFMGGRSIGIWTYYFENGNVRSEGILDDNKKVGEWTFYYEDASLKSQGQFVDEVREGLWNFYFEGGALKAQAIFKNGTGHYQEFYVSGNVKMEGLNKQGKSDSLWTYYFETGEKIAEGYYKGGLKTGPWKYFYKDGVVSAEGGYEAGKTIGNWIYYYQNGAKSAEGLQKNSRKDGYWKMFYETGETKGIGDLNEGTGEYKEYYTSGKLKVAGEFKDDLNHGHWIYYDEEGNIEGVANFEGGIGDYEGHYLNGDIKMRGKISYGKRIGEWTLYDKDGEIAGKYHPVYQEENPIFIEEESLTQVRERSDYDKPEYRFKNNKSRFFTSVVNEYKGVIMGGNPVFSLIGFVPLSLEYYMQERLGYELQYSYLRSPFYENHNMLEKGQRYSTGFSLQLKQKFYSPDQKYGMFYLGHLIGVKYRNHESEVRNSQDLSDLTIGAQESNFYYGVILGNRWMRHPGNAGVTADVYFGLGIGKRYYSESYDDPAFDSIFSDINKSGVYVPVFFGINLGYLGFKKYKNLPVPSR